MTAETDHPTASAFDSWISGALEGDAAADFEAHVHGCPDCSQRLFAASREDADLRAVAAMAREAEAGLPASVAAEAPLAAPANTSWARWSGVVGTLVALAAAVLLFIRPAGPPDVPDYAGLTVSGQAAVRGADAPDATTTLAGGYKLVLQPADGADARPVQAAVYLVEGDALVALTPTVEVAPNGAVRVTERAIAGTPLASPGDKTLLIAVGEPDAALGEDDAAAAAAGAATSGDWAFHRGTLRVAP